MLTAREFVINNFKKSMRLAEERQEFNYLIPKIRSEFNKIKYAKRTGDLYKHFLKFRDGNHDYADMFSKFSSYGIYTNEEIANYLEDNYPDELNYCTEISDFVIGEVYSNYEIMLVFGGNRESGIRPSRTTNVIVVISKHIENMYGDIWRDDVLYYTGQGKYGDQKMKLGNKVLRDTLENHREIHLFEVYKKTEYTYKGKVKLLGEPYISPEKQEDSNGDLRNVYIFPLKLIDKKNQHYPKVDELKSIEAYKEKKVRKITNEEIYHKAKIQREKSTRLVLSNYIQRNPYVVEYVKRRASGFCELCGRPAPFTNKKGEPYLEVHHIVTLANNGPDSIINTIALCPNCHRKVHFGLENKDYELMIKVIKGELRKDPNLEEEIENLFFQK